jgi:hypothetical protein
LNKLDFPSSKDNLYQVWLNLVCWFWKTRFLKIFIVFLLFRYYLPMEMICVLGLVPLFEQTWISFTKRWFVPSLVTIGPVVLEKRLKCIFTLLLLSPLGEWLSPSFEQTWIPFT